MGTLKNKIDYAVIICVKNANPNGDPLLNNRPRTNAQGLGIISDVCLKRKMRNRVDDLGETVFFTAPDRVNDGFSSLQERAENCDGLNGADNQTFQKIACKNWFDVRAFGQLFAYSSKKKGKKGKKEDDSSSETEVGSAGVSVGIRGPVTIQPAISLHPVEVEEMKITKCFNGVTTENGKRGSDTMGDKFYIPFGVYVAYGSINARLAEKTGFSDEDAILVRKALESLFENDESASRPSGSMEVLQVLWWEHSTLDASVPSGAVHRSLNVSVPLYPSSVDEISVTCKDLPGVNLSTMEYGIPVKVV